VPLFGYPVLRVTGIARFQIPSAVAKAMADRDSRIQKIGLGLGCYPIDDRLLITVLTPTPPYYFQPFFSYALYTLHSTLKGIRNKTHSLRVYCFKSDPIFPFSLGGGA
jgi:hypothetical protein